MMHARLAMFSRLAAVVLWLAAAALPAAAAKGVESFSLSAGDVRVTARYADPFSEAADDVVPVVEVRTGDMTLPGGVFRAAFPDETGRPDIFIAEMDPANGHPEVVVEFYSGGAHCCESIYVLEEDPAAPGTWRKIALGTFDGGARKPRDVDGDGLAEIVVTDECFLYAFGSYAESYAPPVILAVRNGQRRNLTRTPRMRPFLKSEERRVLRLMKSEDGRTAEGHVPNGILAGYVALKILLGEGRQGWLFMLRNRNPASPPEEICPLDLEQGECPVPELRLAFPAALALHLCTCGYTAR
jgi:hypothetical protein